jgi:hypothetical protein
MTRRYDGQSKARKREIAAQAIDPCVTNSVAVAAFWESSDGAVDLQAAYEAIHAQVQEVRSGVLSSVEATLVGQATALNTIFVDLARRGQASLDRPGNAAERYLRLALKAQNQCRATLDTLAGIAGRPSKHWEERDAVRRIGGNVLVSQTNIAQANISGGPMQVNNGAFAEGGHEGENVKNIRNELKDWADGEGLDRRSGGLRRRGGSGRKSRGSIRPGRVRLTARRARAAMRRARDAGSGWERTSHGSRR